MYNENPNTRGSERNTTPLQRILLHPEAFDPNKQTVNELEQPDGTVFAKIPQIPNRITKRKKANSDNYYIELILTSSYDAKSQQNRNKKVIIGEDISYFLKGMMVANDNYYEYFNKNGDLLPHIKAMILEEEKQKQKTKTAADRQPAHAIPEQPETGKQIEPHQSDQKPIPTEQTQKQVPSTQEQQNTSKTLPEEEGEASEVQIRELKERQQAIDRKEQELTQREKTLDELRAELENQQMVSIIQVKGAAEDHIELLRSILTAHTELIEAQAKRRPDSPMSKNQIRTINEVLQELECVKKSL